MLKKLSSLPFTGTAEQEAKLNALIEQYKGDKSRLMAVMQGAQDIYGYLPVEVQNKIAEGMEKAVACHKISYSNESKKNAALYDAVKKYDFDCSKLKKKTTTNCCNLVSVACNYAGIKTPRKSSARTMASKWQKYGFKCCKFTGKHLKRGYILVDNTEPKVHTAVYLG
jgi:NADH:ubiquinone oxidoreductase subunit E